MTSTCTWKFSGISRENCVYTAGNPCEAIFQASKQAECRSLLTPRCLKSCPIQDTFSIQFKLLSAPMYFLLTRASAQQHTTALSRLKYLPKRPQLFQLWLPASSWSPQRRVMLFFPLCLMLSMPNAFHAAGRKMS